jgi:hypothetical protein
MFTSWARYPVCILICLFIFASCAKDTVDPESFGDIEGLVIDSKTGDPISGVSISTSPATSALLTDSNGEFFIEEVPTGNYQIQARKSKYSNININVAVREGRTVFASIVMNPIEEDEEPEEVVATVEDLDAVVTSFFNFSQGDSSFVDVYYRVKNTSEEADIDRYEVYFEIETNGPSFFFDVAGDTLKKGQIRSGFSQQYIQQETAVNVRVSDKWVPKHP